MKILKIRVRHKWESTTEYVEWLKGNMALRSIVWMFVLNIFIGYSPTETSCEHWKECESSERWLWEIHKFWIIEPSSLLQVNRHFLGTYHLQVQCWRIRQTIYRRADNFRPVSFTVSAWEWVYATNLSRLQGETRERERERWTSKRHVGEAHSVLITVILLPQRPI
jgi:hypothetical protein